MPSLIESENLRTGKEISSSDQKKFFLLEVVVINVYINDSKLQLEEDIISNFKETCVIFQFLNYPPLVVSEEDFCVYGPQPQESRLTLRSGKSCLFSLNCPVMPIDFDVSISVAKKLQEGVLPNKLVIAKTNVNLGSSFTRLMNENTGSNINELPLPKIMRDTFDLFDDKGNNVGDITVFIRLSCFGNLIITQFQLGPDQKEFYFKGTNINTLPTFESLGQGKEEIEVEKQTSSSLNHQYGDQKNRGSQDHRKSNQPIEGQASQPTTQPLSGQGSQPLSGQGSQPLSGRGLQPKSDQDPTCVCGCNDMKSDQRQSYRTTRDKQRQDNRCQSQPSKTPYKMEDRFYDGEKMKQKNKQLCPYAPKLNLCDCNYPVPSEILPICPPQTGRKKKHSYSESQESFELPPGGVGVRGDQVIFQMHKPGETVSDKDKKMASSLLYKVGPVEGDRECPKQIVQILPQQAEKIPSPTDNEDVFILKIGKTVKGVEGKSNFEVELRTPKVKEPKPETNNQETQYLATDVAPQKEEKKAGKEKGKGKGKGKGKKK